MRFKRLLALLLAAALALAVLVGCGSGQQSVASALLKLLDGRYPNISIEIDPDLEADLRQAVNEGETDAEIRAALEKLLGSGVNFRLIGDGQKGDSAWNLILYPGSDPDAAARSAYLEWDKIFSAFPSSGLYTAKLSMIETDNGYAILVQATVDKAARRNDDDDEPEEPKGPGYTVDDDGNYTVNTPEGLQELFSQKWDEVANATITLPEGEYNISGTFGDENTPFKGILKSANGSRATINLKEGSRGLFEQIDTYGKVENITFDVETTISDTYRSYWDIYSGAVAGLNYGTVTNCTVNGGEIQATNALDKISAGGIAGENCGTITSCIVNGCTINATDIATSNTAYAGGIAGENRGTITDCTVENGSIQAEGSPAYAGGIAGSNRSIINGNGIVKGAIEISATSANFTASAGGLVGNNYGSVDGTYEGRGKITATDNGYANAGGLAGENSGSVAGTWSGDTGSITAQVGLNGTTYTYNASVPTANNSNTDKEPEGATGTAIRAAAGTGIGCDFTSNPEGPQPADNHKTISP